jgi:hypothetical protein
VHYLKLNLKTVEAHFQEFDKENKVKNIRFILQITSNLVLFNSMLYFIMYPPEQKWLGPMQLITWSSTIIFILLSYLPPKFNFKEWHELAVFYVISCVLCNVLIDYKVTPDLKIFNSFVRGIIVIIVYAFLATIEQSVYVQSFHAFFLCFGIYIGLCFEYPFISYTVFLSPLLTYIST